MISYSAAAMHDAPTHLAPANPSSVPPPLAPQNSTQIALHTDRGIVQASVSSGNASGEMLPAWTLYTLPTPIFQEIVPYLDLPAAHALQRTAKHFSPLVRDRIPDAAKSYLAGLHRKLSLLLRVGEANFRALPVVVEVLSTVPGPWLAAIFPSLPALTPGQLGFITHIDWPCPAKKADAICSVLSIRQSDKPLNLDAALTAILQLRPEYRLPLFLGLIRERSLASPGTSGKSSAHRYLTFASTSLPPADRAAALMALARECVKTSPGTALSTLRHLAREAGSPIPLTPFCRPSRSCKPGLPAAQAASLMIEVAKWAGEMGEAFSTPKQRKDWSETFAYLVEEKVVGASITALLALIGFEVPQLGKGGAQADAIETILEHLRSHDVEGNIAVLCALARAIALNHAETRARRETLLAGGIRALPEAIQTPLRRLLRLQYGLFQAGIEAVTAQQLAKEIQPLALPARLCMFEKLLDAPVDEPDMAAAIRIVYDDIRGMTAPTGRSRTHLIARIMQSGRLNIADTYATFREIAPSLSADEEKELIDRVAERVATLVGGSLSIKSLQAALDNQIDRRHWLALFEVIGDQRKWKFVDMDSLITCIDELLAADRSKVLSGLLAALPNMAYGSQISVRNKVVASPPAVSITQAAAEGLIDSVLIGYPQNLPYRYLALSKLEPVRRWLIGSFGQTGTESILKDRLGDFDHFWSDPIQLQLPAAPAEQMTLQAAQHEGHLSGTKRKR